MLTCHPMCVTSAHWPKVQLHPKFAKLTPVFSKLHTMAPKNKNKNKASKTAMLYIPMPTAISKTAKPGAPAQPPRPRSSLHTIEIDFAWQRCEKKCPKERV